MEEKLYSEAEVLLLLYRLNGIWEDKHFISLIEEGAVRVPSKKECKRLDLRKEYIDDFLLEDLFTLDIPKWFNTLKK
jgi:hypothetical protein